MAEQTKTQMQQQQGMQTRTGAWYMITSPHTKEECMQALDQSAQMGEQQLGQWRWGCQSGDHTAYAFVQAQNEDQALQMVPEIVRNKADVQKLDQFSADQIRDMHNK